MAHMPQWNPTKGRENDTGTRIVSRRDQVGHKTLKFRKSAEVGDRDAILSKLRAKEESELSNKEKALVQVIEEEKLVKIGGKQNLLLTDGSATNIAGKYDDEDDEDKVKGADGEDDGFDSSSEEESDDDEDDEAELQAELERIRAVRAAEKKRKEEQAAEEVAQNANPLMPADGGSARVKRRWNDDVVFKNKANEENSKKRFINDPTRSDFHRLFMAKYFK